MDENTLQNIAASSRANNARERINRWKAEHENATARLELARRDEVAALLVSQHEPVHSLGIDRNALRVLLAYLTHRDVPRMQRELAALKESSV